MSEEEIESRILICEMRENGYREVGNTKTADRYSKEKYKWEQLLRKLNPKKDEQLRDYKIGYNNLVQALNDIREIIQRSKAMDFQKEKSILQIIDKYLGSDK